MEIYVFVYLLLVVTIIFDKEKYSQNIKNIILLFDVILMSCFVGLRWKIGSDWDQYFDCFRTIKENEMFHYYRYGNQYFEPLYSFINWFTKYLVGPDGYSFFLFWTTLFRYSLIAYLCKELSIYPVLSFVAYVSIELGFPTARTAVSMALVLASYVYIVKRNLKYYLLLIITAVLIHKMCIIFIPMYWIYGKFRINYMAAMLLYTLSIFFSIVADRYLPGIGQVISIYVGEGDMQEKIETYSSWQTNEGALKSISSYFLSYFWITLFYYQKNKIAIYKEDMTKYNYLLSTYVFSLCIVSAFALFFSDLTRLSIIFNTWFLLLAWSFKVWKSYQNWLIIMFMLFFLYRLSQFFKNIYFEDYYLPYKWILNV